jgi:hypothetical protein
VLHDLRCRGSSVHQESEKDSATADIDSGNDEEARANGWVCSECSSEYNFMNKCCGACGADYPICESWSCPNCTFENDGTSGQCSMCLFRSQADERRYDQLVADHAHAPSSDILSWTCNKCTLINQHSVNDEFCGACGSMRRILTPSFVADSINTSEDEGIRSFRSHAAAGIIFGALGGVVISHLAGRSITNGVIHGAALGALAVLDLQRPMPFEYRAQRNMLMTMPPNFLPLSNNRADDIDSMSYEDLLSTFGAPEQRPATRSNIEALPTQKYSQSEQKIECSICLENLEHGQNVKRLPCIHLFHCACIDKWLNQSGVCPVCKHSLI